MKLRVYAATFRFCLVAGIAALSFCAAAAPLCAAVTTYTSQSAFLNALTDPAYFESFNAYSGQTVTGPQIFSFGPVGFTLTDVGSNKIVYSTNAAGQGSVYPAAFATTDSLVLTFSGNVTAVGGLFFLTNLNPNPVPVSGMNGNVTATLATGEQIVLASNSSYNSEPFGGFTSTTPITSLTLTGTGLAGTAAARITLDNLYVSGRAVPEPGTWALLLAGGGLVLLSIPRRQNAHAPDAMPPRKSQR